MLSAVVALHFSGEVGQHEKTVNGFSRRASAVPRTARCISAITLKPSTVKAPVTIALLVVFRSAYRRMLSPMAFGTSSGTTAVEE